MTNKSPDRKTELHVVGEMITPSNVAMPLQQPMQDVEPQTSSEHRHSFTPSNVQLPIALPIPEPQSEGEGE